MLDIPGMRRALLGLGIALGISVMAVAQSSRANSAGGAGNGTSGRAKSVERQEHAESARDRASRRRKARCQPNGRVNNRFVDHRSGTEQDRFSRGWSRWASSSRTRNSVRNPSGHPASRSDARRDRSLHSRRKSRAVAHGDSNCNTGCESNRDAGCQPFGNPQSPEVIGIGAIGEQQWVRAMAISRWLERSRPTTPWLERTPESDRRPPV